MEWKFETWNLDQYSHGEFDVRVEKQEFYRLEPRYDVTMYHGGI